VRHGFGFRARSGFWVDFWYNILGCVLVCSVVNERGLSRNDTVEDVFMHHLRLCHDNADLHGSLRYYFVGDSNDCECWVALAGEKDWQVWGMAGNELWRRLRQPQLLPDWKRAVLPCAGSRRFEWYSCWCGNHLLCLASTCKCACIVSTCLNCQHAKCLLQRTLRNVFQE
jgi:hypothetical protein